MTLRWEEFEHSSCKVWGLIEEPSQELLCMLYLEKSRNIGQYLWSVRDVDGIVRNKFHTTTQLAAFYRVRGVYS